MNDEQFAVAFSLAGEQRELVEPIAAGLRDRGHRVFYYGWPEFQARLATPHLDLELRRIFGKTLTAYARRLDQFFDPRQRSPFDELRRDNVADLKKLRLTDATGASANIGLERLLGQF